MPAATETGVRAGAAYRYRLGLDGIFRKYLERAESVDPIKCVGRINRVQGLLIESRGPLASIGELCRIENRGKMIRAEVVGLRGDIVQLMAYEEADGLEIGGRVIATGSRLDVAVSSKLLGRVLDPLGNPVDGKGEIESPIRYPAMANPPEPLKRKRITERISTGVRAIDGLLAAGRGQRLGIFAGSGVGKSTLLGMIARNTTADVNVVALIGERGREVNDFIEKDLGPEGLAHSVIIVTPSNSPPLCRLRGAYVATAVAEYFRDQGLNVMFLFDSVTRFARAQREIGLASGEPPATRGFTPSMFDSMPKLLERCGTSDRGTITGFYTILVDGDDMDEPVADTVRGILDGHIILSRNLAQRYHYPAIDVLGSVSRLAGTVCGPETKKAAGAVRRLLADYAEAEDLINVGAYKSGTNAGIDEAIAKRGALEAFLTQEVEEKVSLKDTLDALGEIAGLEIPEDEKEEPLPQMIMGETPGEALGEDEYEEALSGLLDEAPKAEDMPERAPELPEAPRLPDMPDKEDPPKPDIIEETEYPQFLGGTPAGRISAEEIPVRKIPAGETSTEETPVSEAAETPQSLGGTLVRETPVGRIPAEETPVPAETAAADEGIPDLPLMDF